MCIRDRYNCNRGKFVVKTVISPVVMYYDNQNLKDIFMKQLNDCLLYTSRCV